MNATPFGPPAAAATPDETVYDAIARWASHAGRARLAVWAVGGAIEAVGVALVLPRLWLLAPLLLCVAAIGAWGLASQRTLTLDAAHLPARRERLALRAARLAAVAIGTAAAIAAAYGALLSLLGPRWGPDGG